MEPDQQLALSATAAVAAIAAGDLTATAVHDDPPGPRRAAHRPARSDHPEPRGRVGLRRPHRRRPQIRNGARPVGGSSRHRQRQHQHQGPAHDRRNTRSARLPPHRGRGRAPAAPGRGRDRPRQSQHARARLRHHDHQLRPVRRNHPQPVRPLADPRRLVRWHRGGDRRPHRARGPGQRHRRLGADPGGVQRHRRSATLDGRSTAPLQRYGGVPAQSHPGHRRAHGADRRRCGPARLRHHRRGGSPSRSTRRPAGGRPGGVVERARRRGQHRGAGRQAAARGRRCGIRRCRPAGYPGAVRKDNLPGCVARADRRYRRVPGGTVARRESPSRPSSTRSPARM